MAKLISKETLQENTKKTGKDVNSLVTCNDSSELNGL